MKDTLTKMGYRELVPNTWAKPIGFHMFAFELDKNLFGNWFKAKNGDIHIYDNTVYEPDVTVDNDFMRFLKYCECQARTDINIESEFEFISVTDHLLNLIDLIKYDGDK